MAVVINPYNSLPGLLQAREAFNEVAANSEGGETDIYASFGTLIEKHGLHGEIGIGLLHRHSKLNENEIMVEVNNISFPWPDTHISHIEEATKGKVLADGWRISQDSEVLLPYEYAFHDCHSTTLKSDLSSPELEPFVSEFIKMAKSYRLENFICLRRTPTPGSEVGLEMTIGNVNAVFLAEQLPAGNELIDKSIQTAWYFDGSGRQETQFKRACFTMIPDGRHEKAPDDATTGIVGTNPSIYSRACFTMIPDGRHEKAPDDATADSAGTNTSNYCKTCHVIPPTPGSIDFNSELAKSSDISLPGDIRPRMRGCYPTANPQVHYMDPDHDQSTDSIRMCYDRITPRGKEYYVITDAESSEDHPTDKENPKPVTRYCYEVTAPSGRKFHAEVKNPDASEGLPTDKENPKPIRRCYETTGPSGKKFHTSVRSPSGPEVISYSTGPVFVAPFANGPTFTSKALDASKDHPLNEVPHRMRKCYPVNDDPFVTHSTVRDPGPVVTETDSLANCINGLKLVIPSFPDPMPPLIPLPGRASPLGPVPSPEPGPITPEDGKPIKPQPMTPPPSGPNGIIERPPNNSPVTPPGAYN